MQHTICVCGAGTMGSGIAQATATAGFHTILFDLNESVLEKAKMSISKSLQKLKEKNKISGSEQTTIQHRIRFTGDIHDCIADFIIEAIIEKPEAKISLFNQLAEINHSETIFASNTSSLSVTEIAVKIKNPERVIGMHFFNPATIMKLVEIVKTERTNEHTLITTKNLAHQIGKTPVVCNDAPGFIVNRVARPFYIESLRMAEEEVADFSCIDRVLESVGFRMGPFRLMDLIGNDVNYEVSCSVYKQLGNPERLKPSEIQKDKVDNGLLGKKTGQGYYKYN